MTHLARSHSVDARTGGALTLDTLLQIKDVVVPLARELGRWALDRAAAHRSGEHDLGAHAKSSPGDVVTEVDVEVQRRLSAALAAAYPDFGLLGEEDVPTADTSPGTGLEPDTAAPLWVVDPIDGTHNFVRAYPGFCVSVGLVQAGAGVLGVIYDSATDAVFWAVKGGGAWREGERLRVAPAKPLDHALATTGFTTASANNAQHAAVFAAIAGNTAGMRQSGSACRDLCFVAAGIVDLYWQYGVRAWDVAAGLVLVEEAGGAVQLHTAAPSWVGTAPLTIVAGEASLVAATRDLIGGAEDEPR